LIRLIKYAPISDEDKQLVEQLYKQYNSTMLGVAHKILKDMTLAEDAVSESFVKIIRHRKKLTNVLCHETRVYIVSIIRSTSYDILKKRNRHIHVSDDELADMPDETQNILAKITTEEGYASIKSIIKKLPTTLKDVAYRSIALEMTHEEIASELGISEVASRQRLSRAKSLIKQILGGVKNE